MRAVILAGGRGTRLRPYTTVLPKPLIPLGDRPILERIIHQLADAGVTRIDLSVGHMGQLIETYLGQTAVVPDGLEVNFVYERQPLGTAGALKLLERPEEPFLVMNADILTTIDFAQLMRFHRNGGAALTIASHHKQVKLSLGVIEGDDGVVTNYVEKPTLSYEVSMGIYAYSPSVLDHIPDGQFDFPDVVLALLAAEEKVQTYHFEGTWFDIGTPEEHDRAIRALDEDAGASSPG